MTHPADDANARLWYWAFISYSQHDAKWAQWLHGELEKYKIPRALVGRKLGGQTIPQRLIPIFRDREELPSAGDLGEKIREALEASHALVVVCSPHAARSPWVNEEVRAFKALGRSHRVFPLIVDGEPYASGRYSGPEECFPPALRFAVAAPADRVLEPDCGAATLTAIPVRACRFLSREGPSWQFWQFKRFSNVAAGPKLARRGR